MSRNWLEELVAEYFKFQGYLVVTDEDLPMKRSKDRKISGHSDIDVLAINSKEIIHVECKNYWTESTNPKGKPIIKLIEQFKTSEGLIGKRYPFVKTNRFRRVLVTYDKPRILQGVCKANGIELITISDLLDDFISKIEDFLKKEKGIVGKYESPITRLLIHMVDEEFLNSNV